MINGQMRWKSCASREEQNEFFKNNVLDFKITKKEPDLEGNKNVTAFTKNMKTDDGDHNHSSEYHTKQT